MTRTFRSVIVLFAALALPAMAALPRKAIEQLQRDAPEHLHIDITKVSKKKAKKQGTHYFSLTVEAKVLKVLRSESGLKAGSVVTLAYDVPNLKKSPMAGDWAGLVSIGHYEAFLQALDPKTGACKPAARSGSFRVLIHRKGA